MTTPTQTTSRRNLSALLAVAAAATSTAREATAQIIHNIAPSPGLQVTFVEGISGDGSTVVGWSYNGPNRGFRWSLAGGRQDMPQLPNLHQSRAMGCSTDGSVIAVNLQGSGSERGYKWTQTGGYQDLGVYGSGAWQTVEGVSADGLTFFGQTHRWPVSSGSTWAYRWTQAGGFQIILPPTGYADGYAVCSTPDGAFLGGQFRTTNAGYHAMRWNAAATPTFVGTLPYGLNFDRVNALSNDGRVAVGQSADPAYAYRAFRWEDLGGGASVIQDIGRLPGSTSAHAFDCTRDGSVVVGGCAGGAHDQAFIFAQDLGMIDLNTWLPSLGYNFNGFSWLSTVKAISDDGRVIAGEGSFAGYRRAFVARDIPCLHKPTIFSTSPGASTCAGITSSFTVNAGGIYTNNLTYQWLRNGSPVSDQGFVWGSWITGSNSPTITIHNAQPQDAGMYECWVSNPCGGVGSDQAHLSVTGAPTFDYQPVNAATCVGGLAVLSTQASPGHGTAYRWYRVHQAGELSYTLPVSDGTTDLGTIIQGATTPSLLFNSTYTDAAGVYYCVATNSCGGATTIAVNLTVHTSPPMLTQQPIDATTCAAGPAQFTVVASPPSNGPYQYQWFRETTPNVYVPVWDGDTTGWGGCGSVSGAATDTLTLAGNPSMLTADGSRFRCRVTNLCGPVWSQPALLTICPGDYNCDGGIDGADVDAFFDDWSNGFPQADLNCDGGVDNDDVATFFDHWSNGC